MNTAPGAGENSRTSPLSVRIYPPANAISGYVTFIYVVNSNGALTDFLYPEWGNVRFGISGTWRVDMPGHYPPEPQVAVLYGPTDRCGAVSATGGRMAGFGLTPLGWQRLIGGDASAMANRVVPLTGQLGIDPAVLQAQLAGDRADDAVAARFAALLKVRLADRRPDDPLLLTASRVLLGRPATVPEFAERVGVSPRTLHRLCLRGFGFPPKRLLRRERFLETLGQVRSAVGRSIDAALAPDYFDQPHFYRDFNTFMGMSPRAYFGAQRTLMAHAAAAQAAAGVTLSFQLPPPPAAPVDRHGVPPAQAAIVLRARRRTATPVIAKPLSSSAQVAGSGTAPTPPGAAPASETSSMPKSLY